MARVTELAKPRSGKSPSVTEFIASKQLDLVINEPETGDSEAVTDGYLIRRAAVDFGVSLITNAKVALLLALALEKHATRPWTILTLEEIRANTIGRE